jgi:hypothetical protein
MEDNRPKGIEFFNIKSGDTHYCRLEPTIQAYINSSDMGINASRGQDFGWRLAPSWIQLVREFRKNENKMANLGAKLRLEEDQSPSLIQILYAIYGGQLRAARVASEEYENAYEEEYLQKINADKAGSVSKDSEWDNFDRVADQAEPTPAPENPGEAPVVVTPSPETGVEPVKEKKPKNK